MDKDFSFEQYILDHFDAALSNGSIQAFYQPVVRTISRQLCSFEALSRWIDPKFGIIPPDSFISVLEHHRLIHRLDSEIIRQVCERIRKTIQLGQIPVPVSVNLSRLDFQLCDIFEVVEHEVERCRIPHDFLYIEVTESLIADQEMRMRETIDRFHNAGFQVWMDDFGSGYSSLNVLKDFSFDELKMDMSFLTSFHQRSRRILTSVIQMAKEINIHTLAEGVETEEQFRYLRNIGCEKVQGFFFGPPMPYEQAMEHLKASGIAVELSKERRYYDEIGKINLLSAVPFMSEEERNNLQTARQLNSIPLALVEMRHDTFSILFYNSAFSSTVSSAGFKVPAFTQENLRVPYPVTLLPERLHSLFEDIKAAGFGKLFFIRNEEYYEVIGKAMAQSADACCILVRLDNLSTTSETARTRLLDDGLRQIYSFFERITLIDITGDVLTPLYVGNRDNLVSGTHYISKLAQEYAQKWIFREDQERYLDFADYSTVEPRLKDSGRTYITSYFRTLAHHGEYAWKQYIFLSYREGAVIELIRDAEAEVRQFDFKTVNREDSDPIPDALLWQNLIQSDIVRLFWKDRDRRFLGASKAFLDYYGFSPDHIIGKNDEDLGWHLHPDAYMADEIEVIHSGATTCNVPGKCMRRGENREIAASKAPLYDENGRIFGLIGTFIDRELISAHDLRGNDNGRRDILTGLLNSRGISEEVHAYRDEYYLRGSDFIRCHIAIDDLGSINRQYGFDFGDKAIARLGQALQDTFGDSSSIGRYNGFTFVLLRQVHKREEADTIQNQIRQIASSIREIDGTPVTLYISCGTALFSDFGDSDELERTAGIRLLADQGDQSSPSNRVARSSEIFHLYDHLPISFAVYKVHQDNEGYVTNAEHFYVNHQFEVYAGSPASEILGHTTRRLFPSLDEHWYEMAYRAAVLGETLTDSLYFGATKTMYYTTASPIICSGYCCFTYQALPEISATPI